MSRKHLKTPIILISLLLLVGQLGVLAHSVEHSFHSQDESCQIFLQCENSGDGLNSHDIQVPVQVGGTQPSGLSVSVWLPTPLISYFSRAPLFFRNEVTFFNHRHQCLSIVANVFVCGRNTHASIIAAGCNSSHSIQFKLGLRR